MKKTSYILFPALLMVACGDDNSSSANDQQELGHDFGDGYVYAMPYRYDQASSIIYTCYKCPCRYHPGKVIHDSFAAGFLLGFPR